MKKITIILSVIGLLLMSMPMKASAVGMKEKYNSTIPNYGNVVIMETDGWDDKPDGGKFITQVYYVTKTVGGYVYMDLLETTNVKISGNILPGANFELVKTEDIAKGKRVLLKAKGDISGKTEVFTVTADIVNPNDPDKNCELDFSPLGVGCITLEDKSGNTLYLDKNGNSVSKEKYEEVCEGTVIPDTPNTGNPIPYIAVGGGLLAIALVYFYSKKSNKMYKI